MLVPVLDFGPNPGALDMYEYAPVDLPANRPVVVVLHGCTQQADSMEAAGWNTLADQLKFTVVYAQQRTANQPVKCFTWYAPDDITRDSGEAKSIISMLDHAIAAHDSDASRVFVTGVSAGGAFTGVMLADYPDRFAGGSIFAGVPVGCADDLSSAQTCVQMTGSAQKSPMEWGDRVRAASSGFAGTFPRVQIFQGTQDFTVAPANATELVEQWTNVWGIDQTADATSTVGPATISQHTKGGTVAVELYSIDGMGHAIPVGDDGSGACPARVAPFFSDVKVCSTLRAAAFFGLVNDDGTNPDPDPDDMDDGSSGGCSATRPASSLWIFLAACAVAVQGRRSRRRRS